MSRDFVLYVWFCCLNEEAAEYFVRPEDRTLHNYWRMCTFRRLVMLYNSTSIPGTVIIDTVASREYDIPVHFASVTYREAPRSFRDLWNF